VGGGKWKKKDTQGVEHHRGQNVSADLDCYSSSRGLDGITKDKMGGLNENNFKKKWTQDQEAKGDSGPTSRNELK